MKNVILPPRNDQIKQSLENIASGRYETVEIDSDRHFEIFNKLPKPRKIVEKTKRRPDVSVAKK